MRSDGDIEKQDLRLLRLRSDLQEIIEGLPCGEVLPALADAVAHVIGIMSQSERGADLLAVEYSQAVRRQIESQWPRLQQLREVALNGKEKDDDG